MKEKRKYLLSLFVFMFALFSVIVSTGINAQDNKNEVARDEYSVTYKTDDGYVT